jgi:hypothetical protein
MRTDNPARSQWAWRAAVAIGLLLLCLALAHAQSDDPLSEGKELYNGFSVMKDLTLTLGFSVIYLTLYAGSLGVTLSILRFPVEVDQDFIIWIVSLWGGGLVINALAYRFAGTLTHTTALTAPQWLGALIALPLIYGWTVLISTRGFADLTWADAARVAVGIVIVCTPYLGTTWRFHPKPPPTPETRLVIPAPAMARCPLPPACAPSSPRAGTALLQLYYSSTNAPLPTSAPSGAFPG